MTGPDRVRLLVGSYTVAVPHSPAAHGDGIQLVDLDPLTGKVSTVFVGRNVPNPAYLCVHPRLPVVYAVSELWGTVGAVHMLEFSPDFRTVVAQSEVPAGGTIPSYVSVAGDVLLVSTYGDGHLVSYRLDARGEPVEQVSRIELAGRGPNADRQTRSHAHCVLSHPTNGFVYAANLGADTVLQLSLDRRTGDLAVLSESRVPAGSGPRHLAFSPSGAAGYLVEELSSTLAVFAVGPGGALVERQRLSMTPDDATVENFGADVVVAPDGRRVFASNRGHDSVVTYAVEPNELRATGWTSTGRTPRGLALTADGAHLLVANQDGDTVQVLAVTDRGLVERARVPAATPTCLRPLDRARAAASW